MMNQKGSILLNAVVMTLVIGAMSAVMLQQANTTEKSLRLPRVRAAMMALEGAVRYRLLQPSTYTGCDSFGGTTTCNINPAALADLSEMIPGCVHSQDQTLACGVSLDRSPPAPLFDNANRLFRGRIVYQGSEVSAKENELTIVIPVETLQASEFTCPPSNPFFRGFNADGSPNCGAPGACPPGQFVRGINATTFEPACQEIDSAPITCPNGYLTILSMSNGGTFNPSTCANLQPPSVKFGP